MNEELKIIIKAEVDKALKEIQDVNKELKEVGSNSAKSGKSLGEAMKAVAKGAAIAATAIAGITTALIAFGKSTLDAQKNISKLNAAFQSAGSTTKQAQQTYIDLYRFMGDNDAATEAAQSLVRLTNDTEKLAEWAKILQGVYANAGNAIPIEGLAEAANETARTGVLTGNLVDALVWMGISEDAFNAKLAQTNSLQEREALIRSTLNGLYMNAAGVYERNNRALLANAEAQARLDAALAEAGQLVLPLMTAFSNLATTLLTYLKPALEVIVEILAIVIYYVGLAIGWIASFFSIFSGGGASGATETTKEIANNISSIGSGIGSATGGVDELGGAFDSAAAAAKELKKQTMGFDELNVLQSQDTTSSSAPSGGGGSSGGGIGGGNFAIPEFDTSDFKFDTSGIDEFKKKMEEIKPHVEAIATLAGIAAGAFAAWKLGSAVKELIAAKKLLEKTDVGFFHEQAQKDAQKYLDKVKNISGKLLIAAGAISLAYGYSDAWANGIDWGNFALILGGIAGIVGGIALAFTPFAAAIALAAGGVALLVLGIKDLIENGFSIQGVATVAAGALAVLVGVIWAFNGALLANPITWVVAAIIILVATFVILWNKCEAFRNFWKGLWEGIKNLFSAFVDWIAPKIEAVGQFFSDLWEGIKTSLAPLVDAIKNAFKQAWELIKAVWDLVKPYFAAIWDGIKAVFSVVVDVLSGIFKAAWEAIKVIWDLVKPFFEAVWEGIKAAFSVVKEVLGGFFKTAWEAIKAVWDTVVGFFTLVWNGIAGVFSVVKNVLSGNFKEAWEAIKGIWNGVKSFFEGIWTSIKNVFSAGGIWIANVFTTVWNGIKNVFSKLGSFFAGIWDGIKNTFSALGTKIGDAIGGAIKAGINGIIGFIENTINGAIKLINGAISIINYIPGVDIGKIGLLSLPRLAKGGIVDSTTIAMIGEQGKEAVVPLENNTEWMDKLAERIANRNSAPSKIVLTLDGKELGWANIHSINSITKQTGNLPLVLV